MPDNNTTLDYNALIDEAMHNIVKKALFVAQNTGLPGKHHFYISFLTNYKGVILSKRVKKNYPYEITIVLQHQFNELHVLNNKFKVSLSFNGIRENIVVPFAALTAFADPSVRFGLQFKHDEYRALQNLDDENITTDLDHGINRTTHNSVNNKIDTCNNIVALDSFRRKKDEK